MDSQLWWIAVGFLVDLVDLWWILVDFWWISGGSGGSVVDSGGSGGHVVDSGGFLVDFWWILDL